MKTILVDAYRTFVTEEWINQEMFEMLEKFENKKIILTMADDEKQKELGLVKLPYELFTSNFNPPKSDPEYYKIFLERYNLNKDEVVYFEHDIEAVKSARSIWINTYNYNYKEKNIIFLKEFLDNNL